MRKVYLDNAATTPLAPEVLQEMHNVMKLHFGNPSSIHHFGREAKTIVEQARKDIASALHASIGEIYFTSGGTEANNTAIKCSVRDLGIERVISSGIEHPCVLNSIDRIAKEYKTKIDWVKIDSKGRVELEDLERLLRSNTKKTLVSIMHANNEVGTMNDLYSISGLCQQFDALFHSDTVQTVAHFPIDLSTLRMSFISGSAHKFHGPKGVGFLYVNGENQIQPFIDGGGQERNMRSGTENVPGIAGMAKAVKLMDGHMDEMKANITELKHFLIKRLTELEAGVSFHGDPSGESLYTVLSVAFPESPKTEFLVMNLDIAGISASGGSACSSGAEKASHVIQKLHPDFTGSTIRFSFSPYTTREEIDYLITKLSEIL
jgi:cysteine desulfurase